MESKLEFCYVADPTVLISVLKERHPASCMIYNQVQHFKNFKDDLRFYTVGKEVNSHTWIVSNNIREDYQCNFSISAPLGIVQGQENVSTEVKECFSNGGDVFNWFNFGDVALFTPMPKPVSDMIIDISTNDKGNVTEIHPCYLYFMEIKDALELKMNHNSTNVQVRRLDAAKNEANFILKTWNYARPGSEIEIPKCIIKNASGGVFVNGECVCGLNIPGYGFLAALYTLPNHRKKGYAKLAMNYTFKEYARDGCIPCLDVEAQNSGSIKFHESIGLKVAFRGDILLIKKLDID